jgi:hypothetical protein
MLTRPCRQGRPTVGFEVYGKALLGVEGKVTPLV